jgi:hypothetical protein
MPKIMTQSMSRLRTLAIVQALVLLVALGAPIAALAAVDSVSPASLAQGATSQPVTITGSGFDSGCATYAVTFSGSGVSATGAARSSNTVMTASVTVTAGAAVGLRDVTASGSGGCTGFSFLGTDKFTVTAGAGTATKLAITSISPPSPTVGTAFSVVVQAQDGAGNPADVTSTTRVSLSLNTGTGTLGGTRTGLITNGRNSVTISGVTYSKAETGVILTATRTSGMSPLASGNSAAFTVVAGPATKLAITSVNGGVSPTVGTAFSVVVQSQDARGNPANVTSTTGVSLSRHTGTGTLGGTLTDSITSGANSVTISGVTYSKAETGVRLTATRTSGMSLTAGNSAAFTVVAGTFTMLQVLVPGEIAAPRTASGKTGTPTAQTAGTAFTVTVNAVDATWNVVSSTHTVGITSSDAGATLPANAALVAGTKTFSVTLNTAGSRTVTATDITDAAKTANTSAAITVVSPGSITLTRSRGMITYGESVSFSVQFGTGGGNKPFVLEYTSVGVPWTTIANLTTNSSGFASATYAPRRTGYVRARFAGTADLGAATSTVYIVGVRQTVTRLSPHHAATQSIARGTSIAFRTTVRPLRADLAASSVTFRFYRKVSGAWVLSNERHVLTDSSGVARTTFRFGSGGSWYVRAYAPRTPYNSISRFTLREYYLVP